MKIYIITKGEYSDYHICGVTEDKKKAEKLKNLYSDNYGLARIEPYETEDEEKWLQGYKKYFIRFNESGEVNEITKESLEFFISNIIGLDIKHRVYVRVLAKNETDAIKIGAEKRAKFLAEKEL